MMDIVAAIVRESMAESKVDWHICGGEGGREGDADWLLQATSQDWDMQLLCTCNVER